VKNVQIDKIFFCKWIEIYKTNKLMKKYPQIFKKLGVAVLGGLMALEWALQKVFFANRY